MSVVDMDHQPLTFRINKIDDSGIELGGNSVYGVHSYTVPSDDPLVDSNY